MSIYTKMNKKLLLENIRALKLNDAMLNLRMFIMYNDMSNYRF